jgi:hypothetical protein
VKIDPTQKRRGNLTALRSHRGWHSSGTTEACSTDILEVEESTVQRDMDLVRDLLLNIEADRRFDGTHWHRISAAKDLGIGEYSDEEVGYHVNLLIEAGFLRGRGGMETIPPISKLTWQGHEFIDNIRDVSIWEKTKARLHGIPSVALTVVASIAEAEIKKRLGLTS